MDHFQKRLTKSIEKLLEETSIKLSTRKSYVVEPCIDRYRQKRKQIVRAGLPKEYLDYYDGRFQCMLWELTGLEMPKLEELK